MADKQKETKPTGEKGLVALRLSDKEKIVIDAAGKLVPGGKSEVLRRGGMAEAVRVIQEAAGEPSSILLGGEERREDMLHRADELRRAAVKDAVLGTGAGRERATTSAPLRRVAEGR